MTKAFWRGRRLYYSDRTRYGAVWPANPEVWTYDDFDGTDTTSLVARTTGWTGSDLGTNNACTISNAAGIMGRCALLSGTTDNDHDYLQAGEYEWFGSRSACFEARVTLSSAAAVGLMIGFSDAAGLVLGGPMVLGAGDAWTVTAQDGAMFVYDTDADTDLIHCHTVNNLTETTAVSTGLLPVAATYNTYRVELEYYNSQVTALFYVDGILYATIADAVATTAGMAPFVGIGCRTGGAAKTAYIDYVRAWQNRS